MRKLKYSVTEAAKMGYLRRGTLLYRDMQGPADYEVISYDGTNIRYKYRGGESEGNINKPRDFATVDSYWVYAPRRPIIVL